MWNVTYLECFGFRGIGHYLKKKKSGPGDLGCPEVGWRAGKVSRGEGIKQGGQVAMEGVCC